jgi:hypothetical protein
MTEGVVDALGEDFLFLREDLFFLLFFLAMLYCKKKIEKGKKKKNEKMKKFIFK